MLSETKSRLSADKAGTTGKMLIHILYFFLLVTQICFAQWVQVGLSDKSIKDIAVQNSTIFAITSDSGKVYRSLDDGNNWTMIVDSNAVDVEISLSGKVFIVQDSILNSSITEPSSLFTSLDSGKTWVRVDIPFDPRNITVDPSGEIFCLTYYYIPLEFRDIFFISTDDGLSWNNVGPNMAGGLLFDFRDQYVLTFGHAFGGEPFHLSTDYGNTWSLLGYIYNYGYAWDPSALGLFSNANILITGINVEEPILLRHTFVSTDMCSTWTQQATLNDQVGLSVHTSSSEGMLVGTDSLGIFMFSDEGDSLGSRNEGLTNLNVQALTLDNNGYVYAGSGNGVWRRPLTEVTAVEENSTSLPSSYILSQNFPNPFNPSTKLSWQSPVGSWQTLIVFDVLGSEILTLVDEYKPAGRYKVEFNAATLPSGVYFYQLKAGEYTAVKKMLLLK